MVNHYRWDFIGLSTDNKPTPATSEKVTDGSTFYCADNSKLYVYCKDNWYEKTATGGGGYELPIASAETLGGIKVGSNLTIDAETGVLSATGGGGSADEKIKILTSADYNEPATTPNHINLHNLSEGYYLVKKDTSITFASSSPITLEADKLFIVSGNPTNPSAKMVFTFDSTNGFQVNTSPNGRFGSYVVNNLTSTEATRPLSALQGKTLNEKITALEARVSALEG